MELNTWFLFGFEWLCVSVSKLMIIEVLVFVDSILRDRWLDHGKAYGFELPAL